MSNSRSLPDGILHHHHLTNRATPTHQRSLANIPTPQVDLVTIYPDEYDHAIKNPLKGFRPFTIYSGSESRFGSSNPSKQDHEYGSLIKNYFRWNELENVASDDVNKIKSVCSASLAWC